MKRLLTILTAAVLLVLAVGCSNNNAEVEQVRKELDEMKAAMPVATTTEPATATAPNPPTASRTAFYSERDGDPEISVMDADRTHVQQLTDNDDWDGEPSWSLDGKRIAFDSWRDEAQEIFVMDAYLTKAAAADKAKAAAATKADKAKAAAATKAEDGDPYPTKTKA
jgi:dipeptidyl aminopeptidase/acylaminoacyl peptidase